MIMSVSRINEKRVKLDKSSKKSAAWHKGFSQIERKFISVQLYPSFEYYLRHLIMEDYYFLFFY